MNIKKEYANKKERLVNDIYELTTTFELETGIKIIAIETKCNFYKSGEDVRHGIIDIKIETDIDK